MFFLGSRGSLDLGTLEFNNSRKAGPLRLSGLCLYVAKSMQNFLVCRFLFTSVRVTFVPGIPRLLVREGLYHR